MTLRDVAFDQWRLSKTLFIRTCLDFYQWPHERGGSLPLCVTQTVYFASSLMWLFHIKNIRVSLDYVKLFPSRQVSRWCRKNPNFTVSVYFPLKEQFNAGDMQLQVQAGPVIKEEKRLLTIIVLTYYTRSNKNTKSTVVNYYVYIELNNRNKNVCPSCIVAFHLESVRSLSLKIIINEVFLKINQPMVLVKIYSKGLNCRYFETDRETELFFILFSF